MHCHRFLLVKLHLNSLASKHTVKEMRADLRNLPEGENAISDTYDGAFSRIRDQTREDRELGEKIILWISHAQRPLTMKDLQCILTLQEGDTDLEFDDLIPEELLISTCAGLVTVENLSGRIQFVHSTAQEYVDSIKLTKFPGADLTIAKSCIHYLSLSIFCTETKEIHTTSFNKTVSSYPFLEYAALFWGLHARRADSVEAKSSVEKSVRQFFNLRLQSTFAVRTLLCGVAGVDGAEMGDDLARNDRSIKLINILAYFGLDFLLVDLISSRPGVIAESFDHFVGNVLHWAALGQHEKTLKILLSQSSVGDVLNQKGYELFAPLHMALVYRRDLSAEIILDYGPDVRTAAHFDHTPLLIASLTGNSAIIPKLLSADKELKTLLMRGHSSTTPFRAAAMWGHKDVMVELLRALDHYELSEDLHELRDDFWRNPMHNAAEGGHVSICEVLLQSKYGVQFATSEDGWSMIPMEMALLHGHVELTELFLNWNNGTLLASEPGTVAGALTLAAHFGQPMVADMLLARHPEACSSDFRNYTALHHAAYSGSVETVKVILGYPAGSSTLEARDKSGNTPLVGAADRGQSEIVEYLLEKGANINAKNDDEKTALHLACEGDLDQVIKILLQSESDIDIEAKDSDGRTALVVANEWQASGAIKLLLGAGAQIPEGFTIFDTTGMIEQYSPEQPVDQFKAYFYLKKASADKLPQPLISNILDLAEYWIVRKTERYESKHATNFDGDTMVYLRSAPIIGNPHHPVRRIEYEVVSHDQGFSNDHHVHGTYECSYTWFDASRECSPGPFQGSASRILGPIILRNVHARNNWHKHRITWCSVTGVRTSRLSTDESTNDEIEETVTTVHPDHRRPRPEPLKWITEINPGERILMTAMAQFPGWTNYIQRAKFVVYTSYLKSGGVYQN
jgi:ankyrin repeat protein